MAATRTDKEFPAFRLSSQEIEDLLRSGEQADLLREYFGPSQYEELREAAQSTRGVRRAGKRVLVLPGIMGSTLGIPRKITSNTIWVDPVSIAAGELTKLSLGSPGPNVVALDVVPYFYTRLKLTLWWHGYDVDYYHYDWRQSLDVLGEGLADYIEADSASEVYLVAHSMGGLVSRAALAQGATKVKRLIMLGTPNNGSFAPVQVMRGVYSAVKMVAALDVKHDLATLTKKVFSTFPGLYQLMPARDTWSKLDLYDPKTWEKFDVQPRAEILEETPRVHGSLAPADDRFFLIAGVNQTTATDLTVNPEGDFSYVQTPNGDGTVPLQFAKLDGVPTWYVEESHGNLALNKSVIAAVEDVLEHGVTKRLSTEWTPQRAAGTVRGQDLAKVEPFSGRRGKDVTPQDVHAILENLQSPARSEPVPTSEPPKPPLFPNGGGGGEGRESSRAIVIGRPARRRLDFVLHCGSITDVPARAYVLGAFANVTPSGPMQAIDKLFGGAITDFASRRMFAGGVGEVFMMPRGTAPLQAETVLFVGLGQLNQFVKDPASVQQFVAENVFRTLSRVGIDEFAMVLVGGNSGPTTEETLVNLVLGFVAGFRDIDRDERVRRVILCENNAERYAQMRNAIYELARWNVFEDFEITIYDHPLDSRRVRLAPSAAVSEFRPRYFLHVSHPQVDESSGRATCEAILLTSGGKASAIPSKVSYDIDERDRLLAQIGDNSFDVAKVGKALGELMLTPNFLTALADKEALGKHLVVVHDAESSKLPWETLRCGERIPAIDGGMSRKYILTENFSIAKWLESSRRDAVLDILLIVNPTEDLDGAETEGEIVQKLMREIPNVKVKPIKGKAATKEALLKEFKSANYDVIHYAGHAMFDEKNPGRSGILCAGHEVLGGADLATIGNLPALVFFNACESGRVRRAKPTMTRLQESVSFAEAFLRGGIANFIGTYWPVGDASAEAFARTFYGEVVQGTAIGDALIKGRKAVFDLGPKDKLARRDWADYIHYGDPDFQIKERGNE